MSIYGSYLAESIQENTALLVEDIELLNKAYIEACIDIVEDSDDTISEGVNWDNLQTIKSLKKNFREHCKACKSFIKSKEKSKAKKEVAELKKLVNNAEKEIKVNKGSIGSAIAGNILGILYTLFTNIIWVISGVLIPATFYQKFKKSNDELVAFQRDNLVDDEGHLKTLNLSNPEDAEYVINRNKKGADVDKKKKAAIASAIIASVLVGIKLIISTKKTFKHKDLDKNDKNNMTTQICLNCIDKLNAAITNLEKSIDYIN